MKKSKRKTDKEIYEFLIDNIKKYDENKNDDKEYLNQNRLPKLVDREKTLSTEEKNKINYAYINDKLRLNLTKAFNSYLPNTHLRNLNIEKENNKEKKK